ncbi:MAG: diaminopimelate decarboxylase [Geminicoccaceae bacterium]|nr:diaminopimelate decarboxylase [Geminicoccaceae bacterium]
MDEAFCYRDGELCCEEIALSALARRLGTPLYVYSANAIRARYRALARAFGPHPPLVCYALKANHNLAVIRTLAALGAGADTVSAGEILRARRAGVPASKIVFAGVAKTDQEIRLALEEGILQLNVESAEELERIAAIASSTGRTAPIALRVNPDVAAATHEKIATGRRHDKFGIDLADAPALYEKAASLPGVEPVGVHLHIGSQILDLAPFERAYARAVELVRGLRARGLPIRRLDLGGGLGVRYGEEGPADVRAFAELVRRATAGLELELVLEPGRFLVAEAGVLVASVIYLKETGSRRFLVLDAGMNALVRPAMYGARHAIAPLRAPRPEDELLEMDVVGPICESSDIFGRDYRLPRLRPGDLLAFRTAGAYGMVMASDYNSRPSPAEVLVDGARWAVIRRRREPEEQMANEEIPAWLEEPGR